MEKNQQNMFSGDGTQDSNVALPPSLYYGSDQYGVCNNFQIAYGRELSYRTSRITTRFVSWEPGRPGTSLIMPIPRQGPAVNGLPFTVVGVYAEKDPDSQWFSMDNIIVFPYSASRLLSPGTQHQ